jgi:hypothetical protein
MEQLLKVRSVHWEPTASLTAAHSTSTLMMETCQIGETSVLSLSLTRLITTEHFSIQLFFLATRKYYWP